MAYVYMAIFQVEGQMESFIPQIIASYANLAPSAMIWYVFPHYGLISHVYGIMLSFKHVIR